MLAYLDMMSGGALSRCTLFALGVTPYINASIIVQLLTVAIPSPAYRVICCSLVCPSGSFARFSSEGIATVSSCTMMEALILGT